MAIATNQDKMGIIAKEAPNRTISQTLKTEETATGDSGEVKNTLGIAFQTYLEGRKNLAQAFKERGQHDQEAYRDAEQRYRLCEETIEKAMKVRERAELYASDVYREDVAKGVDSAARAYDDKTKQLLVECKQRVMEAWRSSTETSAPMASVCEEAIEKAMKIREKAELDALDAYKENVDKAVEKASRAYKDRMKQALTECMQRVMSAWVNSMDTSMQMTGVFTEDGNIKEEAHYHERKTGYQKLQLQVTIIRVKRKLMSTIQRALMKFKFRRYS